MRTALLLAAVTLAGCKISDGGASTPPLTAGNGIKSTGSAATGYTLSVDSNTVPLLQSCADGALVKRSGAGWSCDSSTFATKASVDAVSGTLGGVSADVGTLKTDVTGLKTDVAGAKTDIAGLKTTSITSPAAASCPAGQVLKRVDATNNWACTDTVTNATNAVSATTATNAGNAAQLQGHAASDFALQGVRSLPRRPSAAC